MYFMKIASVASYANIMVGAEAWRWTGNSKGAGGCVWGPAGLPGARASGGGQGGQVSLQGQVRL